MENLGKDFLGKKIKLKKNGKAYYLGCDRSS